MYILPEVIDMTFKVREKDLEGSIALYNKFIVILKIILI